MWREGWSLLVMIGERERGRGRVGLVMVRGLVMLGERESVTTGQMGGEDSIRRVSFPSTDRSRCFERAMIKSGIVFLLQEGNCSGGVLSMRRRISTSIIVDNKSFEQGLNLSGS